MSTWDAVILHSTAPREPHYTVPNCSTTWAGFASAWVVSGIHKLDALTRILEVEEFDGDLKGKIVLMGGSEDVETPFDPIAERHDHDSLEELFMAPIPGAGSDFSDRIAEFRRRRAVQRAVTAKLRDEGVAAILEPGGRRGDYGVFFVGSGGSRDVDADPALPSLVVAREHYNRVARLLEQGEKVEMSVEVQATFHDDDLTGRNVIAEIRGSDPELRDEVVMLGAHYDSWHAGTGVYSVHVYARVSGFPLVQRQQLRIH